MSDSEQDREENVRRKAYELWDEAGQPEGRDEEFWHQAHAETMQDGVENQTEPGETPPEDQSQKPVGSFKPTLKKSKEA